MNELETRIAGYQARIERVLDACLALPDPGTARLREAMRYSVLGGGKRLRPVLVYATGQVFGASLERLDAPAAAVELVHVYSLVHDDLPAMDDDELRRGRPTCHRAFDEATAILVGDALQALAFAVLANGVLDDEASGAPPASQLAMIRILARATGTGGMAGGQAIDLAAAGRTLSLEALENMHRRKTGALIQASVLLGATAAGVEGRAELDALTRFGAEIGLAFQIQDDILDVEGDAEVLGKSTGADAAHAKPTYPSTVGLKAAHAHARAHCDAAVAAISALGARGAPLAALARLVVDRVQ
ncbi:MAG: (2E,6E)-farnesyl diphosphate synthase [Gammaproteobacteria bacterium]